MKPINSNAEQPNAEQSNAVSGRCMTICNEFKINDSITIPCWCVKIADDNGPDTVFLRGHDVGTLMGYAVPRHAIQNRVEQICRCTWGDLRNIPSSSESLKAPLHWRDPHVFVSLQGVESLVMSSTKEVAKYLRKLFGVVESNAGSRPNAEQAYVDTPAEQPQTPVGLNSEQSNDEQTNDEQLPTLSIAGPVSGRYMELVKAYFKVNDSEIFPCWIVKIVYDNGLEEYWFLGHDVAEFLGYELPNKAIYDHVETRWKCTWDDLRNIPSGSKSLKVPPYWKPHCIFLSLSGVYQLFSRSRMPEAQVFEDWLHTIAIPSLSNHYNFMEKYFLNGIRMDLQDSVDEIESARKHGHVYFATNDTYVKENLYKIGATGCLRTRLASLNTSSVDNYYYVRTFKCNDKLAYERLAHEFLKDFKHHREFFKIPDKELIEQTVQYLKDFEKQKTLETLEHRETTSEVL